MPGATAGVMRRLSRTRHAFPRLIELQWVRVVVPVMLTVPPA